MRLELYAEKVGGRRQLLDTFVASSGSIADVRKEAVSILMNVLFDRRLADVCVVTNGFGAMICEVRRNGNSQNNN